MKSFIANGQLQRRYGLRRLLVISGDEDWSATQAYQLSHCLAGDWLWVSAHAPAAVTSVAPGRVRTLLGQEQLHAVFDARRGLDAEALAVLAGVLKAGSWLLLLVPAWDDWPERPDEDSLRWSEQPEPIITPHFIRHFRHQLLTDEDTVIWRQGDDLHIRPLRSRSDWYPASGTPTCQQQRILARLQQPRHAVSVITAPRGRGKSTLAGMLTRCCGGECWVIAPSRAATDVLLHHSGDNVHFWAPDALLEYCRSHPLPVIDWLLVDEAAAIPAPVLHAILPFFPRILLTTTVLGYEGTGRGFLLKFCSALPDWQGFELTEPLRWAGDDPLERLLDRSMLFTAEGAVSETIIQADPVIDDESRDEWLAYPQRLAQCYGLLCSAHYRTSPLDLRRLMDAPGMHVASARHQDAIYGVIWSVDEGGLSASLAHEVWAGRRRPRGNLVAQSLAAHGGQWLAPILRSRRISRIAITAAHRRHGIGRALVDFQQQAAQRQGLDYLSVSFGFQADLWAFWHSCGFTLVRIGSHIEASSGCYSAMALLPLSEAGQTLTEQASAQLARDWYWLRRSIPLMLDLPLDNATDLSEADWENLAGFAFAYRPPEACLASLSRLMTHTEQSTPALRLWLVQGMSVEQCVQHLHLTGRKALIQCWRNETASVLRQLDSSAEQRWREWSIKSLT
ncbi:GNAT family N-acetyltransferase [Pectobacteriaceae bacterium CE90]|nr:GNAT family N-acetyltransferase [Pectobacteriaceae bacterium CE90]